MTSHACVLLKLGAETHWVLWKNLCFFKISSKQRALQKRDEIYCSCNFLFYVPNFRIFMNKKLGVPFIQLKIQSFDGK